MGQTLRIIETRSGFPSAKVEYDDGTTRHLHSTVAPEEERFYYNGIELWGEVVLALGTGLGYHLLPILSDIPEGTRFVFVDYHPELVEQCARSLLGGYGVPVAKISSATPDPRSVLREYRGSRLQVIRHPASVAANPAFYHDILDAIAPERGSERHEKRRILLLHGNFFLQEELFRASRGLGLDCTLFHYERCGGLVDYGATLDKAIDTARPDVILSVNMKGFDGSGVLGEHARAHGVPVAVWFVDDPHPIMLQQEQFTVAGSTAFCWERAYVSWLAQHGFARVEHLPLATDPSLLTAGSGQSGPEVPLAFVGSSMGRSFLADIAARFMWRDDLRSVVAEAASALLKQPDLNAADILSQVCARHGLRLPYSDKRNMTWLCSYIIHTASMVRRREIVMALIPLGIETFGDPDGWRELCGESLRTHGDIDYRTQLGPVYRNIDINVNITSCQMPTALNQRVFDIPVSGGFVVTDHQPDLFSLFAEDELVTYRTAEELCDKVVWFREHPSHRRDISGRAKKRILGEHTYECRLRRILASI